MTQPVLRYQPEQGDAADGAIFVFAVATDPEALLMLEARRHSGALRWEYARICSPRYSSRAACSLSGSTPCDWGAASTQALPGKTVSTSPDSATANVLAQRTASK